MPRKWVVNRWALHTQRVDETCQGDNSTDSDRFIPLSIGYRAASQHGRSATATAQHTDCGVKLRCQRSFTLFFTGTSDFGACGIVGLIGNATNLLLTLHQLSREYM